VLNSKPSFGHPNERLRIILAFEGPESTQLFVYVVGTTIELLAAARIDPVSSRFYMCPEPPDAVDISDAISLTIAIVGALPCCSDSIIQLDEPLL